jgi:hypothetical protein
MLSLALLIGCAALWVRSVEGSDSLTYRGGGGTIRRVMTVPHVLAYQSFPVPQSFLERVVVRVPDGWYTRSTPWGKNSYQLTAGGIAVHVTEINQPPSLDNLGLGFGWSDRGGERLVTIPFWSLAVAFSILPVVWLRRACRDRVQQREGLCSKCGYDLRATPGRCPECGHRVSQDFQPAADPVESADP